MSRIERYIPGMAFLYGFYQEHEENDKQEVSASVVAASPNTIDVKVKFPEVSQEIPSAAVESLNILIDLSIYTDVSSPLVVKSIQCSTTTCRFQYRMGAGSI